MSSRDDVSGIGHDRFHKGQTFFNESVQYTSRLLERHSIDPELFCTVLKEVCYIHRIS